MGFKLLKHLLIIIIFSHPCFCATDHTDDSAPFGGSLTRHTNLGLHPSTADGRLVVSSNPLRDRALVLVNTEIEEEINDGLTWRRRWSKCSNVYEFSSIFCMGASGILAFSSGFFTIPALAYAAGAASTVGLVLKGFSTYASGESAERTASVNAHLRHLGIAALPAIENPSLHGGNAEAAGETGDHSRRPADTAV